ncbi:MAG: hypothetical protein ACK4NA_12860 [Alphaproteobacteria bacterium]
MTAVQQAIYQMSLDPQAYVRATEQVAQANAKVLGGVEGVQTSTEKLNAVTRTTADGFSRLEARYDPLIRAEQRRAAAIAQANRYLQEGSITQERHAAQIARVNGFYEQQIVQLNRLRGVNDNATRGFGAMRGTVQQLGYQVGDFAVQVASGQNAVVAFTQQGSQMLQVFGPLGAVLGAGLSIVGALAVGFLKLGQDTEKAKEAAELATKAQDAYNQVMLTGAENADLAAAKARGNAIALTEETIAKKQATAATYDQIRADQIALRQELEFLRNRPDAAAFGPAIRSRSERLKEIDALVQAARDAQGDVDELQRRLDRLRDGSPSGAEREAAAKAEKEAAESAAKATEDRLKFTQKIIDELDADRERQAANDNKRNVSVEKYIAGLEAAATAEQASGVEKDIQRGTLEAQNKLIDDQGVKLRDLTDVERERIANAVRLKDETEKQRQEADRAAKEAERQAERTLKNIQSAAGDIIFDYFTDRSASLWDTFKRLALRALADIAAQRLVMPIITPIVGGILGGSSQTGFGGMQLPPGSTGGAISSGGFGFGDAIGLGNLFSGGGIAVPQFLKDGIWSAFSGLDGTGAFASDLINGISASPYGIIGTLGAKLLGLNGSGNMAIDMGLGLAGSVGGAAIGSSMGTILGMSGGPVGAVIGAFAGQALASLFGGGKSGYSGGQVNLASNSAGQLITTEAGFKRYDGDQALAAARQFVDQVNDVFAQLGLSFAPSGNFANITFGQESLPIEATIARLFQSSRVVSGNPELDAAIRRLDVSGNADQQLARLGDLVDTFNQINALVAEAEPVDQVAAALKAVNDQFDMLAAKAAGYGLSLGNLEQARQQALDRAMQSLRLTVAQPYLQSSGQIVDYLNQQALNDNSSLSAAGRLSLARDQYDSLLARVRGGETGLTGNLTAAADRVLTLGRDAYASSPAFVALESGIRQSLLGLADRFSSDAFIDAQVEATRQQTLTLDSSLQAINDSVQALRREIALLRQQAA